MTTNPADVGDTAGLAAIRRPRLQDFLSPLLPRLGRARDRRPVKTFAATISISLGQRRRASGLLLSERGVFLATSLRALLLPQLQSSG
jgi:hypothetical protein